VEAKDVVAEYFRCIRDQDPDGMRKFFTSDGVKIDYQGTTYTGIEELIPYLEAQVFPRNFHWHMPDGADYGPRTTDAPITHLTPLPPILGDNQAAVEVAVNPAEGPPYRTIDLFKLNDEGRVWQLLVYKGPHVPEQ
jgi:hypothetical protein